MSIFNHPTNRRRLRAAALVIAGIFVGWFFFSPSKPPEKIRHTQILKYLHAGSDGLDAAGESTPPLAGWVRSGYGITQYRIGLDRDVVTGLDLRLVLLKDGQIDNHSRELILVMAVVFGFDPEDSVDFVNESIAKLTFPAVFVDNVLSDRGASIIIARAPLSSPKELNAYVVIRAARPE